MKYITTLILTAFASTVLSEELSSMSQEEIDAMPLYVSRFSIPLLTVLSKTAGIGMFTSIPSPTNRFVDIAVQQWWTPNPGTNDMLRVYNIHEPETNSIFPTNEPVVFFANVSSNVTLFSCTGRTVVANMTQEERERPMFWHDDRSWFRVSRDNGLLYSFATSMWHHAHVDRNLTNEYEFLRDTFSPICDDFYHRRPLPSWRVAYDAYDGLNYIFDNSPEKFLSEIMDDPLLPGLMWTNVVEALGERFCWDFDTNGVFRAPDTAVLDFASSNFTAQALAVWRTHDTNSIISFAQDALAENATPEAMLFRGTVAYYLENEYIYATNLVYSANKIIDESDIHTPRQKEVFSHAKSFFYVVGAHPLDLALKVVGSYAYVESLPLEVFWEEHSSDAGIFEKFGGEFPFSKTLKYMYNRE